MADYANLKSAIQEVIKTNGNNEITGALLQQSLLAMINSLGGYYQFAGIATPSTNPGTPDQNVFYLASTAGTYSNFGSIVIAENEAAILKYNGTWLKDSSGFATSQKVSQLDDEVTQIEKDALTENAHYILFEPGNIDSSGNDIPSSERIRSIDYISISGSPTYAYSPYAAPSYRYYDSGKNYLGSSYSATAAFVRIIIVSPSWAGLITITIGGVSTVYNTEKFKKALTPEDKQGLATVTEMSNKMASVYTRGYINFDNANGRMVLSQSLIVALNGNTKSIPAGNYAISMTADASYYALCIDPSVPSLSLVPFNAITGNKYIIGCVVKGTSTSVQSVSYCAVPYRINDVNLDVKTKLNIGNLFSMKKTIVRRADGEQVPDNTYSCTGFIPIDKTDTITVRGSQGSTMSLCNFYKKDKTFITSYASIQIAKGETPQTGGDVTETIAVADIPSDAYFIRCCCTPSFGGEIANNAISFVSLNESMVSLSSEMENIENTGEKNMMAASYDATGRSRETYLRDKYQESGEAAKWYGVQWNEGSSDGVTAINSTGDSSLHTSLPIQSKMRRCVVRSGIVQYYLNATNSELKADGTTAKLDGTDGDVMVEIPEFFYRFEEETVGGVRTIRIKISEQGLPGFMFSRKRYTSAYEATVNRTTSKLASVCTTNFTRTTEEVFTKSTNYVVGTDLSRGTHKTAVRNGFSANASNYRGGTNDDSYDTATVPTNSNFARNQLGIPVANINRTNARKLADNKSGSFIHLYDTHKILWILSIVEYKSRNIQTALGVGATVYPNYSAYESFFAPQGGISCLPCGITNSLGNESGTVFFKMQNVPVDSSMTRDDVWMPVISYRGVENYYGHIYKICDQVNILCEGTGTYATGHSGDANYEYNDVSYAYQENPYLADDSMDDAIGTFQFISGTQVISSILGGDLAHILPIDSSLDGYNTNYFDCVEIYHRGGIEYPAFNGRIVSGNLCGSNFIVGNNLADNGTARPSDGTRLDMII